MMKKIPILFYILLALTIISLFKMPYGFYMVSRLAFTITLALVSYKLYKASIQLWVMGAALVILYNPLLPIHLGSKEIWFIANVVTVCFVFFSEKKLLERNQRQKNP